MLDAERLTGEQMHMVAAEFNLSETASRSFAKITCNPWPYSADMAAHFTTIADFISRQQSETASIFRDVLLV